MGKVTRRQLMKGIVATTITTGIASVVNPSDAARNTIHLTISSPSGTIGGAPPFPVSFQGSYVKRRTPISGATIYLFDSAGSLNTGVTDSSGNYSIPYTFANDGSFLCWTSDSSTGV